MLEIIALIFLTREIGKIADRKGLNRSRWKFYTVIAWLISEIIGVSFGIAIFSKDNLFSIMILGIIFAVTSFYIIRAQLEKLPDQQHDDPI